jgi:hypothetical protein
MTMTVSGDGIETPRTTAAATNARSSRAGRDAFFADGSLRFRQSHPEIAAAGKKNSRREKR